MSQAWEYFEKVFENNKVIGAKCKICNKKLSPNTSGMKFHAISFHQIKISLGQTLHNIDQQPTMKNYFPSIEKDSLKNLLSRLCAKDGLPFSILASSEDIRKGMAKLGFDLPKSTETIRKHILEFADDVKQLYKLEITKEVKEIGFMSISIDEWTSNKNKKFLNLNIHSKVKFWNLGLVRINGSTNHHLINKEIAKLLNQFDIRIENIIGLMSDGASINTAIANEANLYQQQCLAHGMQLAIKAAIYDQNIIEPNIQNDDILEDEIGFWAFGESIDDNQNPCLKNPEMQFIIKKVRKCIKYFKKSSIRNDDLQKIVELAHGKKLELILDVPTRWNSLKGMLQRFFKLRFEINSYLAKIDDNEVILFTNEEFKKIQLLYSSLQIIESCIEVICKKNCSLVEAFCSIEITLNELADQNNQISNLLKDKIIEKIQPRLSPILQAQVYLVNKDLIQNPKYFKLSDLFNIKQTLFQIINRLPKLDEIMCQIEEEVPVEEVPNKKAKLDDVDFYAKIKVLLEKPVMFTNIETKLNEEFQIYNQLGKRGVLLEKVYLVTQTIKPSSCDCERAFSVANNFCNKLRSSLCDNTLEALCFLKNYFINSK